MDCPICSKTAAFKECYDICDVCGWEDDPFMNNEITVKFFDCEGNEIKGPDLENIPSPNHCNSIVDAREAWIKYNTKYHFNKDKAPLTAEERMKIREERKHIKPRKEISQEYTEEEHNRAFKYIFGIDRKKDTEKED